MSKFTELAGKTNAGEEVSFSRHAGRVVLAVNVARLWDVREVPGLVALGDRYADAGLDLLFFPCNQFCSEEPGSAAEIAAFYVGTHGLPARSLMERGDVNGSRTQPAYRFLKASAESVGLSGEDIEWNFSKFVVGRDGQVMRRYGQGAKPPMLEKEVASWLG